MITGAFAPFVDRVSKIILFMDVFNIFELDIQSPFCPHSKLTIFLIRIDFLLPGDWIYCGGGCGGNCKCLGIIQRA